MEIPRIDDVYKLLTGKLETWMESAITILPNIVVALIIAIAFGFIARIVGNIAGTVMRRTFESRQIAGLLTSIVKSLVLIAGIFIALDFVGLKGTVTSLLAGAGIIGLAIGFAFQDMTENFIAGIAMGIRKPFEIGDVIKRVGTQKVSSLSQFKKKVEASKKKGTLLLLIKKPNGASQFITLNF